MNYFLFSLLSLTLPLSLFASSPQEQLLQAAQEGQADSIIQLSLADDQLSLDTSNHLGETPLILACKQHHWLTAQTLIDRGANINALSKNGCSPLLYCCLGQQEDMVVQLINKGADVEVRSMNYDSPDESSLAPSPQLLPISNTPLMWCALLNKPQMLNLLLDRGADINAEGPGQVTALSLALDAGHQDLVATLINRGASIGVISGAPLTKLIRLRHSLAPQQSINDFVTLSCTLVLLAFALLLALAVYLIHRFHAAWDD